MSKTRLDFQTFLETFKGDKNVYFQPPPSVQMKYEAIVYSLNDINVHYADDIKYKSMKRYSVIAISKNPDSELCDKLLTLPYSELDRFYTADNLNHWVITLYF